MTSILNVDTIADKAGTGAVTLTKASAAKALFNATDNSTLVSGGLNISSLNDRATGFMTISLTNNMSSTALMNCHGTCSETSSDNGATNSNRNCQVIRGDNAGEVFVATSVQNTGALEDTDISNGVVHGDLA